MTSLARQLTIGASRLLVPKRRKPPAGAAPGTLAVAPDAPPPRMHLIAYDANGLVERDLAGPGELAAELADGVVDGVGADTVVWIDVQGLGDETTIHRIGDVFAIHPLALADAVNVPQRPKSETWDGVNLFITRMLRLGDHHEIQSEQLTIFFGARFVVTLQEQYGDVLDPVRQRIRTGKGLMRRSGPDYLAYAIIDTVIDGYYPVVEAIGDRLEELEELVLDCPTPAVLARVHRTRRELLGLRRAVWPQREAVNGLVRDDSPLVSSTVRQYLRDCYDHAVQLADVIETYRELAAGLMDIYLSSVSQRTNEVMKVLTIMSTIFIPLTFLAGIYGMNFEYMPELHWRWAYPALMGLMAAIAILMLAGFWRRGWIGHPAASGIDLDPTNDGR